MSVPSINFRIRKEKKRSQILQGYINLYGKEAPKFSTQIKVTSKIKWNQKNQQFEPTNRLAIANNNTLLEIQAVVIDCFNYLSRKPDPITSSILKREFLKVWRKNEKTYGLIEIYDLYNEKSIAFRNLEPKTLNKYKNAKTKLSLFLSTKLKKSDIDVEEVTLQFGHRFFNFMTTIIGQGSAKRYLQYITASLEWAFQEGLIAKNILGELKIKVKRNATNKTIIPEEMQLKIYRLDSLTTTERHVADISTFLFYTAFDHCDYFEFDYAKHIKELDNELIIEKTRYKRRKADNPEVCTIRINNILKEIFDTYPILPRYPAKTVLEIYRNLCSRIGFKDFEKIGLKQLRKSGATYYLNNDVPLKVLSEKILGHDTVAMTERIYTKVQPNTVMRHTEHLKNR